MSDKPKCIPSLCIPILFRMPPGTVPDSVRLGIKPKPPVVVTTDKRKEGSR